MKKLFALCAGILLAANADAQLSRGLIAHWPFSNHIKDVSGKGHTGTAYNVTFGTSKAGVAKTAAYFNGTNSYISVPYKSDLNIDTFSICAIVKPMGYYTGPCHGNYIMCRGDLTQTDAYGLVYFDGPYNDCNTLDTSQQVFTGHAANITALPCERYTPNIVSNTWYCVVATYDGQTSKTYVNGVLKSTCIASTATPFTASTNGLSIGAYEARLSSFPYWLKGYIDDLRLYNRILSTTEIDSFCNYYNGDTTEIAEGSDTTTAINSIQQNSNELSVYPNPSKGHFTISGGYMHNSTAEIVLVNVKGQIVLTEKATVQNNTINHTVNTASLPAGMYYVRIVSDFSTQTIPIKIE